MTTPLHSEPSRELRHTRSIELKAFERSDGNWDIEAELNDIKAFDFHLNSGTRKAGDPVHSMRLCITINKRLDVLEAKAQSRHVPYPGHCETIAPDYSSLVGLNLFKGFRQEVKARFSGVKGCTHMTDLAYLLPTAAVQAFAGAVFRSQDEQAPQIGSKPFALDRCHALKIDTEAVRLYYPQWYQAPLTVAHSQNNPKP